MPMNVPSNPHTACKLNSTALRREGCRAAEWEYLCSSFHGLKLISFARQASLPRLNRALAPSLVMHDGLRSLRAEARSWLDL